MEACLTKLGFLVGRHGTMLRPSSIDVNQNVSGPRISAAPEVILISYTDSDGCLSRQPGLL